MPQRIAAQRLQRGTTLIEAMIALAILAIGLTGFTTAMFGAANVDRRNSARAAAKAIADELAAEIASWEFTDARLAAGGGDLADPTVTGGVVVLGTVGGPASTITGESLSPVAQFGEANLVS